MKMIDPALASAISAVYDAAIEQSAWPNALARIGDFLDVALVGLTSENPVTREATLHVTWADSDDAPGSAFLADYITTYSPLNPMLLRGFRSARSGMILSMADFVSEVELRNSRFFNEWLARRNLLDSLVAVLDKTVNEVTVLGTFRHERHGFHDMDAMERMRLIAPHVRRATMISTILRERTAASVALIDLLDQLTAAVFLLGPSGQLMHANVSGEAMLGDGDVFKLDNGVLEALDRTTQSALRTALGHMPLYAASQTIKDAVMLTAGVDGTLYSATLLPLSGQLRGTIADHSRAIAALFVKKARFEGSERLTVIQDHFGLTTREWAVLTAIVRFGDAGRAADELGLSNHTVKHHLKNIFRKTGSERQIDLAKIMAWASAAAI